MPIKGIEIRDTVVWDPTAFNLERLVRQVARDGGISFVCVSQPRSYEESFILQFQVRFRTGRALTPARDDKRVGEGGGEPPQIIGKAAVSARMADRQTIPTFLFYLGNQEVSKDER